MKIPDGMSVNLIRYPNMGDWNRCYVLALNTAGKFSAKIPTEEWLKKILIARHSPIRTLMYTIELRNIPYYSSVHFARHKIGVEHYVQSQRINPERGAERQDAPVTHIIDCNAEALLNIMEKRLCFRADEMTRTIAQEIKAVITCTGDPISDLLMPACGMNAKNCCEMKPCGKYAWIERKK